MIFLAILFEDKATFSQSERFKLLWEDTFPGICLTEWPSKVYIAEFEKTWIWEA